MIRVLLTVAVVVLATLHPTPSQARPKVRPAATSPGVVCDGARSAALEYRLSNRRSNRRVTFTVSWIVQGHPRRLTTRSLGPRRVASGAVRVKRPDVGHLRVSARHRGLLSEPVSVLVCRDPHVTVTRDWRCRRGDPQVKVWLDSRGGTLAASYFLRVVSPSRPYAVERTVRVPRRGLRRVWLPVDQHEDALYVGVDGQEILTYSWSDARVRSC